MMNSKIEIQSIDESQIKDYSFFICSASFEERSIVIPERISNIKANVKSIVFYNENQYKKIQEFAIRIGTLFKDHQLVKIRTDDPILVSIEIKKILEEIAETGGSTLIDITTFTHEALLILIDRVVKTRKKNQKIDLIYNGAVEYSFNEPNVQDKWLTKGIGDVRSIIGFPGIFSPAKKTHLIILFGFEVERSKQLIEKIESDIVSLGFGAKKESIADEHFEINYQRHESLLKVYDDVEKFEFSLVNYSETAQNIENQIDKYPDHNIIIAAMNNKVSTIAAAMVGIRNRSIQLCYVEANDYNIKGYSKPGKTCYLMSLDE